MNILDLFNKPLITISESEKEPINALDLLHKPLITISESEKKPINALDLLHKPIITISESEKEPINALDLLNEPISNEFNNSDTLKSPIKVIGIDVPSKLNTKIKINVIKPTQQDKSVIEQQTPVKVIRVQVPKSEPKSNNCQDNKTIKINIIKTDDQKMNKNIDIKALQEKDAKTQTEMNNLEADNKLLLKKLIEMNNLEADNKLLSKKLAEITTAYGNVCNYNKNLSIALSMRR